MAGSNVQDSRPWKVIRMVGMRNMPRHALAPKRIDVIAGHEQLVHDLVRPAPGCQVRRRTALRIACLDRRACDHQLRSRFRVPRLAGVVQRCKQQTASVRLVRCIVHAACSCHACNSTS